MWRLSSGRKGGWYYGDTGLRYLSVCSTYECPVYNVWRLTSYTSSSAPPLASSVHLISWTHPIPALSHRSHQA